MKNYILIIRFLLLLNFFSLSAQNYNKKLVAIFAHPDDEQSVAPILVKFVEEGVDVTLVIATDGRLGVNDYSDYKAGDILAEVRRKEMVCAAEILGVKLIHLNYHDQLKAAEGFNGHVPYAQDLIIELKQIISKIKPDAIITWGPDGVTTHMDHRLIGASVTQIYVSNKWDHEMDLFYFGTPNSFLINERQKSLRGQEQKFLTVQIPFTSNQYDVAYESLLCHKSQYPAHIIAKMKDDRKKMGNIIYFREFSVPQRIRNSLF